MNCECGIEGAVCDIHVGCDRNCRALRDPQSPDEIRAAYEHWHAHRLWAGCSHGC